MGCASSRSSGALLALDVERSDGSTLNGGRSHNHTPVATAPLPMDEMPPSIWATVLRRFPWLLVLMLVQSISGAVVDHFSALVERHVVLASFLTMLVGGGGNSSGQTVVETVRVLSRHDRLPASLVLRLLVRELGVGAVLAALLGMCAYPRVRLLSSSASDLDALTIALAYACIVTMANAIGVVVAMALHLCDMAAVGAPPVVQVVVDVLGVTVTMIIAQCILGDAGPDNSPLDPSDRELTRALS